MVLAALIIGVAAAYHQTLDYPFVFDDLGNIAGSIQIENLSIDGVTDIIKDAHADNRPIANLSFAINWLMGDGDTTPFHITNLLIHIVTGFLVYLFAWQTLCLHLCNKDEPGKSNSRMTVAAAAVGLIWTMHPIQTQAVTYIVQRMTSMCTLFCVLALCLYVAGRSFTTGRSGNRAGRVSLLVASAAAWVVALGCKEIAISLPALVWLYEWFFFRQLQKSWLLTSLKFAIPVIIIAILAMVFYLETDPLSAAQSGYRQRDYTMLERQLTQFRVLILYLSLLVLPLPSRLNLDHHVPHSTSLIAPISTLLSLAVVIGLIIGACLLARRHRLLSFCILWYFITMALESSIIGIEMVFEHRLYLPSIGVVLGVVTLAAGWSKKISTPNWSGLAAIVLVATALAAMTWQRNKVWAGIESLYLDCAAKSPNKPRAHYNLGVYYGQHDRIEDAIDRYRTAVRLRPKYIEAQMNLGLALMKQEAYKGALTAFNNAVRYKPDHGPAYMNRAVLLRNLDRLEDAVTDNLQAVALLPDNAKAKFNLGATYGNLERYAEAIDVYTSVLALEPDHADAHANIGVAYIQTGDIEKAVVHLLVHQRLAPDSATPYVNLGNAYLTRDPAKAQSYFESAIGLDISSASAHNGLAAIALARRNYGTAVRHFENALATGPDYRVARTNYVQYLRQRGLELMNARKFDDAEPLLRRAVELAATTESVNHLGAILGQQGKLPEAIEQFEKALAMNPQNVDARRNLEGARMLLQRQQSE